MANNAKEQPKPKAMAITTNLAGKKIHMHISALIAQFTLYIVCDMDFFSVFSSLLFLIQWFFWSVCNLFYEGTKTHEINNYV